MRGRGVPLAQIRPGFWRRQNPLLRPAECFDDFHNMKTLSLGLPIDAFDLLIVPPAPCCSVLCVIIQ